MKKCLRMSYKRVIIIQNETLRRIYNGKRISGHTGLLALIGSPVGHSGSPAMYNYSFENLVWTMHTLHLI